MKKLTAVLACFDILLVAILLMGYPQKWFQTTPEDPHTSTSYYNTSKAPSQESSAPPAPAAAKAPYYLVREYQGHIGVFMEDSASPFEEVQVDIDLLPATDRALLRAGIRVEDTESLNRMIEDYES